jgi:ABC-type uncharacterized transport system involved in gliding motility auxiliary subunit
MARSSTSSKSMIALVLGFLLLVGVNYLAQLRLAHQVVDVTQHQLFTVSDNTKKIIADVKEPLHVRLFFSEAQAKGLPVFQNYAVRVRGLLEQYAALSGGKITLDVYNPKPFTEAEDIAVAHGLEGVPIDTAGNIFYFGVSIENSTDNKVTMPFLDPARDAFLEYDISRLIYDVSEPEKRTLGIISTLPMRGGGGGIGQDITAPWTIYKQLQAQFDVEVLPTDTSTIPDSLKLLMLVHPHSFSDETLYAIDQYIIKGGRVAMFLDSYSNVPTQTIKSSRMDKILSHWGLNLVPDMVVAEKAAAMAVQVQAGASRLASFPNVTWLNLGKEYLQQESVITNALTNVRLIDAGYLEVKDNPQVRLEPLIVSSPAASLVDEANIKEERDIVAMYRNYMPAGKEFIMASHIKGIVTSAFDDTHELVKNNKNHVATSQHSIQAVIVTDTDMLQDAFWVDEQNFFNSQLVGTTADNGALVMNIFDYLSGSDALINLRTRGVEDRRFTALDALRKQAELAFRDEEERLKNKLMGMESALKELQSTPQDGSQLFTDAQTKQVQEFKDVFVQTRKELRAVQLRLVENIERLGNRIALVNILGVPLLLLLAAFFVPALLRKGKKLTKKASS